MLTALVWDSVMGWQPTRGRQAWQAVCWAGGTPQFSEGIRPVDCLSRGRQAGKEIAVENDVSSNPEV